MKEIRPHHTTPQLVTHHTTPQLVIQAPVSTEVSKNGNLSSAQEQESKEHVDLDQMSSEEELVPCVQRKQVTKSTAEENFTSERDKVKSSKRKANVDPAADRDEEKDSGKSTPRKKKKKRSRNVTGKGEELPPLNIRTGRPLPLLPIENDQTAC